MQLWKDVVFFVAHCLIHLHASVGQMVRETHTGSTNSAGSHTHTPGNSSYHFLRTNGSVTADAIADTGSGAVAVDNNRTQ